MPRGEGFRASKVRIDHGADVGSGPAGGVPVPSPHQAGTDNPNPPWRAARHASALTVTRRPLAADS